MWQWAAVITGFRLSLRRIKSGVARPE